MSDVSDISDWIQVHQEELTEIARVAELDSSLVHLVAVLVLAGIDDAQIFDQLNDLTISLDGSRHPLAGAPLALEEIRRLTSHG